MKTTHITKSAVTNHKELFPNLESKLQKTDPEFIELFDNWAFDEVKGHVTGNINVGNDRTRLIDVVTQLLPYIGYPRTLNALRVIDDVVPPTNITNAASTAH